MKIRTVFPTKLSLAVAAALFSSQAMSAGFALNDHSATASGNALAGAAASRSDISFSFWNPALFTNAKEMELYASGALVMPEMDVNVNKASSPGALGTGNLTADGAPDNIVDNTLVPSVYFAYPLSDKTVAGVSLNVPFGLSGKYGDDWAGRYHSAKTSLRDISISGTLAHRLTPQFSLGASIQVHKADVALDSAVLDLDATSPTTVGPNSSGDGYGDLDADDVSYGFALGAHYEPVKGTRLGLGYRSEIDFEFEGDAEYSNVQGTYTAGVKGIKDTAVAADLTFPSVFTLSAEHDLNNKLTLGATVMKTGWSSLDELRIKPEDDKQDDIVLTFDFEDQWFYSIGATYQATESLVLRSGLAMDHSPATDEYRSARTPDGNRKWLSLGASYNLGKAGELVAAYTRVSIEDVTVNRTGNLSEDTARGELNADYKSSANVLSFAYNVSF